MIPFAGSTYTLRAWLPSIVLSAAFVVGPVAADDDAVSSLHGLPLVFSEDFEGDLQHWEMTDDQAWYRHKAPSAASKSAGSAEPGEDSKDNHVLGLNRRISDYQPKVRSPHNIALIKKLRLEDFVLTFRVRSTKDTGNHRDCCAFFCHQDPEHFYYVHLGAVPDPHSGQIMIVNGEPRKAITTNEKRIAWNDSWHSVKVIRDSKTGVIEVYFDDMENPAMRAVDKTFGKGRIGIGSFDDMNDFDDVKLYGR